MKRSAPTDDDSASEIDDSFEFEEAPTGRTWNVTVHNAIYQASVNKEIPIGEACRTLVNIERSEDKKFTLEVRRPPCKVTVHEKGSIMVAGRCDVNSGKTVLKAVARRLRDECQVPVKFNQFQCNTMMGVANAGGSINLDALGKPNAAARAREPCKWLVSYDTQIHPAAKFTIPVPLSKLIDPEAREQALGFIQRQWEKNKGRNTSLKENVNVVFRTVGNSREFSDESTLDVAVNVYGTGKLSFNGPAHEELLTRAMEMLRPGLQPFVRTQTGQ